LETHHSNGFLHSSMTRLGAVLAVLLASVTASAQDWEVNRDMLLEMGAQNAADRAMLNFLLNTFGRNSARVLILVWLWWRFRPFSLTGLGITALTRYWCTVFQKPLKE